MYNSKKRCDNHKDDAATGGNLNQIFQGVLYGYYYEYSQCDDKPFLKFTLYFVTPFDNIYAKKYGDPNGTYKKEIEGFENTPLADKCKSTKNMQVIPLQYDDYYGGNKCGLIPKTRPEIIEAFKTNVYKDKLCFFDKLFRQKSAYQIKTLLDHNMFYKVTFEVPFDAIAEYITVDKILIEGGTEKTKSLYAPPDLNYVDALAKRLTRARSILNEMDLLVKKIRSDPDKFKRDNRDFEWFEECRTKGGLNIENTEFLLNKVKADFEKMENVLYNALAFDLNQEPKDIPETKCSHDLCTRERVQGSKYCDKCIQLNTRECNYCKKG